MDIICFPNFLFSLPQNFLKNENVLLAIFYILMGNANLFIFFISDRKAVQMIKNFLTFSFPKAKVSKRRFTIELTSRTPWFPGVLQTSGNNKE